MNAYLFLATCPLFDMDEHFRPFILTIKANPASCHQHQHSDATSTTISTSDSTASATSPETTCCFLAGPFSFLIIILTILAIYALLSAIMNLIACYNFVMAWNMITRIYHVDLSFIRRRHTTQQQQQQPPQHQQQQQQQHPNQQQPLQQQPQQQLHNQQQRHRHHQRFSLIKSRWSLVRFVGGCGGGGMMNTKNKNDDSNTCCPVCLEDFDDAEPTKLLTSCEGGCGAWFHQDCLFEWLDRSDSCPCCRRDMVPTRGGGWMSDLTVFLGYSSPHY